jgi:hypothetical protein
VIEGDDAHGEKTDGRRREPVASVLGLCHCSCHQCYALTVTSRRHHEREVANPAGATLA